MVKFSEASSSRKLLLLDPSEDSHHRRGNTRLKVNLQETNSAKRERGWEIHPSPLLPPTAHLPPTLPRPTRSLGQETAGWRNPQRSASWAGAKRRPSSLSLLTPHYVTHCSHQVVWMNSKNGSLPTEQIPAIPVKHSNRIFYGCD